MKKIISWGVMLAAAFTLTNCAKEIDNPAQQPESAGYPFEIVASTVDTKTVNDGMSTKWAANDQINLFHAVTGDADYQSNGAFTVKDVEAGSFTGNLSETLDVEEEYDWYALYPYREILKTPAAKNQADGYTYIGHSQGLNQTGYGSKASLKGSICPLYGIAKAVPGADMPTITMNHLSSIVAINITNDTDKELTVTTASLTAAEKIVGSFYIDFTATSVKYTPSEGYASEIATVYVSEGEPLEKGESAILYLAIKPFTAAAGQKLTLSVNAYSKEITLPKDVTFSAGKIKTVNFSYNKVDNPNVPAFKAGKYWIVANGKYAMPLTGNYGYLKVDNAGYTDNVYTFADVDGGYTIQQADGKYLYMTGAYDSFNVSATIPSAGGHVWTIEQNDDGSYKILNVLKAKYIQLDSEYGTYGSYNTVKGTMPNLVPADDATVRPIFTVDSNSKRVASDVTEASFEITSNQNWTVVPGAGVSADITSGNGDATVTLNFAENKSTDDIVYTATVKANGFEDIVLTVTQEGVPSGDEPIGGGQDDFATISNTNTSYTEGNTTAGWNYKNCAVFKGGTSDSSPAFKMIGDASNRALCMNGKTTAVGSITSPTLTAGCGTLTFNYGLPFSDTKIKFRVDIMQNGASVKSFIIDKASATKLTKYSHEEVINVAGDFQIIFTNLSPSNSTSNKDRTAIWDVVWTGCN